MTVAVKACAQKDASCRLSGLGWVVQCWTFCFAPFDQSRGPHSHESERSANLLWVHDENKEDEAV